MSEPVLVDGALAGVQMGRVLGHVPAARLPLRAAALATVRRALLGPAEAAQVLRAKARGAADQVLREGERGGGVS